MPYNAIGDDFADILTIPYNLDKVLDLQTLACDPLFFHEAMNAVHSTRKRYVTH